MNKDEIKDLKQFCLDYDTTITDAVKYGLELLKSSIYAGTTKDGNFILTLPKEKLRYFSKATKKTAAK